MSSLASVSLGWALVTIPPATGSRSLLNSEVMVFRDVNFKRRKL